MIGLVRTVAVLAALILRSSMAATPPEVRPYFTWPLTLPYGRKAAPF